MEAVEGRQAEARESLNRAFRERALIEPEGRCCSGAERA